MNDDEIKEWMKRRYPELVDFDNLQFVKDCAEDGVKKYKDEVKEVIGRVRRSEHSYIDNYQSALTKLEKELGLEVGLNE